MKKHLNTLFVTTSGTYLRKEGQAVAVRKDKATLLRVPLHNLDGIVVLGRVSISPALLGTCGELGIAVTFLSNNGRFLARSIGFTSGNVFLRREQYRWSDSDSRSLDVARPIVAAKIANTRHILLRARRDHPSVDETGDVRKLISRLNDTIDDVIKVDNLDSLRGLEGDAAKVYFAVFNRLITAQQTDFVMQGRSRRPPMDNVNALLSFVYAILTHDVRSACEAAGLDPAVGYLHRDRPGRPGLALDIVEEFRAFLADRLVLSLINRRQVAPGGFQKQETGGVNMDDKTRKTVVVAYQKRKDDEIMHPFLNEKTTVGILPHLQARLLARFIRGELDAYPAFIAK